MATKAELEAELAELRRQMEARPGPGIPEDGVEMPPEDSASEKSTPEGPGHLGLDRLLQEHGASTEDIRQLMGQLNDELGKLPETKPVLTALGAFGLGFVLGRMTK